MKKLTLEECASNRICTHSFIDIMREVYSDDEIMILIYKEFLNYSFEEIAELYLNCCSSDIEDVYNMVKYDFDPIPKLSFNSKNLGWVESTRNRNV